MPKVTASSSKSRNVPYDISKIQNQLEKWTEKSNAYEKEILQQYREIKSYINDKKSKFNRSDADTIYDLLSKFYIHKNR